MKEDEKQPAANEKKPIEPATIPADEVTHDDGSTFDDGTPYAA